MADREMSAETPTQGSPAVLSAEPGFLQRYAVAILFLAPALVLLGVWVVYPAISTIYRSFLDANGDAFVGLDNYRTLFTDDTLRTAIRNNVLWILVVPAFVTAIGLVFAVLLERIRFAVAFKVAVFMPMAISLFAAGVIWRLMYERSPDEGTVNAAIAVVKNTVSPPGAFPTATPSTDDLRGGTRDGLVLEQTLSAGSVAPLGLTGIRASDVPSAAEPAVLPEPLQGGITGVVWRDFKPGGGVTGKVDDGELGLPGVTVELRRANGTSARSTRTERNGTFAFENVGAGNYRAAIAPGTFAAPYQGVSWLGASLITPAIMISYIWIWAGFAMVVIAAGLAAIPRDLLEAARTDGATEWDVFRRVTIPLLAPVLTVVFITMLIYVLKVFDIVISIAPGASQDDANVIALAMWRTAFGSRNFGLGAAIAVFLFLLVIPILALNIRRFRRDV